MSSFDRLEDVNRMLTLIADKAKSGEEAPQELLDGLVIDTKLEEATRINNGGFRDQVEYILDSYGKDGAKIIEELLK